VVELRKGEIYAGIFSPDKITLSVDAGAGAGNFTTQFEAEANKEYVFEVSPQGSHAAAKITATALFGVIGNVVSSARAARVENAGPFKIMLKEVKPLQ
jgi:hypothetical protein